MPEDNDLTAPGNRQIPSQDDDTRMTAEDAGYMELDGAQKDAECDKVNVEGGVSSDLGCCNEFDPVEGTQKFSCGTCTYLTGAGGDDDAGN